MALFETNTVSVVIPCYNGAAFVREAIESVLAQTHPPHEVLVIDDGSTDDSAMIAASFGPPVRVICQANQGESVARNRGLDEACGEWVAFLDADDYWRPRKLALQLAAANPDVLAVHTNYNFFGNKCEQIDLSECPPSQRYDLTRVCLLQNKDFNVSSLMVRRAAAARFPTWTRYGEDLIYFAELLMLGHGRIALVDDDLVCKRRHSQSQSAPSCVQLDWHRTIDRWVAENKARIGSEVSQRIRSGLVDRLVSETQIHYWKRDWESYWTFRRFLQEYRHRVDVARLLAQRIYPRWFYSLKDQIDRALQPTRINGKRE